MNYFVGTSSYHNSYGSANSLDIWNQNRGYTQAQVDGYGGVKGLGDLVSDAGTFLAGGSTGVLLLAGFFVAFAWLSTKDEKREKLAKARAKYDDEVRGIREEYGRFGLNKYRR